MTRNKKFALFFFAAFVLSFAAISAHAQAPTAPIVIKSSPAPAAKPIKAHFEVLHMMVNAIQVRSIADQREIHTFTYDGKIRDRMQAVLNSGGYRYGDKVVIRYVRGSDVALRIDGKPSKPS